MRRSFTSRVAGFGVLLAVGGTVAWYGANALTAQAQTIVAAPPSRAPEAFSGKYALETNLAVDGLRDQLRKATAHLQARDARSTQAELEGRLMPARFITFEEEAGSEARLTLKEGRSTLSAPLGAAAQTLRGAAGRSSARATFGQSLRNGDLVQSIDTGAFQMTRTFAADAKAGTLTVHVSVLGAKLSAPIDITVRYKRTER